MSSLVCQKWRKIEIEYFSHQGSLLGLLNLAVEHHNPWRIKEFSSCMSFDMFLYSAMAARSVHWTFSVVFQSWRQSLVDFWFPDPLGLSRKALFQIPNWWSHLVMRSLNEQMICGNDHGALRTPWVSALLSLLLVKGGSFSCAFSLPKPPSFGLESLTSFG